MKQLLSEGGKCIYVAPSGGRDRPNSDGSIVPEKFDSQSVELFHLISKQTDIKTNFYVLALATYSILPPPNTVEKEIGERRQAHSAPVFLHFSDEIDLDALVDDAKDKSEKRTLRAQVLTQMVRQLYGEIDLHPPLNSM